MFIILLCALLIYINGYGNEICTFLTREKDRITLEKKYAEMIPIFNDEINDLKGLTNNSIQKSESQEISIEFDKKVVDKWFSLAKLLPVEKIINEGGTKLVFPEKYPQILRKKVYENLESLDFTHFPAFINCGSYCAIPSSLMSIVCNFFSKKFLTESQNQKLFLIQNDVTKKYFYSQLDDIKNIIFMMSNQQYNFEVDARTYNLDVMLQRTSIPYSMLLSNHYDFSSKHSFIFYALPSLNQNTKTYKIHYAQVGTEDSSINNDGLSYDSQENNSIKNESVFIKHATEAPCFISMLPYSDSIVIHYPKEKRLNKHIKLDLVLNQEFICCDISPDGKYIIVGYRAVNDGSENPELNKFIIFNDQGKRIKEIKTEKNRPVMAAFNPIDSETVIMQTETGSGVQYTAKVENNVITEPFGVQDEFHILDKDQALFKYSSNGEYIIFISVINERIFLNRLDSVFLDKVGDKIDLLIDISQVKIENLELENADIRNPADLQVNNDGDIALVRFRNEHGKYDGKIINFKRNTMYSIKGNDIIHCFINGYCLIYIDRTENGDNDCWIFDLLHHKQIAMKKIPKSGNIIGLNKDFQLLVATGPEKLRPGKENIKLINIVDKAYWQQIMKLLDSYEFLEPNAENPDNSWLGQLTMLLDKARDPEIDSLYGWLTAEQELFSYKFKKLILPTFGIEVPNPQQKDAKESGLMGSIINYGARWKLAFLQSYSQQKAQRVAQQTGAVAQAQQFTPATIPLQAVSPEEPGATSLQPASVNTKPAVENNSDNSSNKTLVGKAWSFVVKKVRSWIATLWGLFR